MPELDWDHLAEVLDKASDSIEVGADRGKWTDPGDPEVLGGPLPDKYFLDGVARMPMGEDLLPYFEQDVKEFQTLAYEIMMPAVREEYPKAESSPSEVTIQGGEIILFFLVADANEEDS